jgi:RHS repeat-associated protein
MQTASSARLPDGFMAAIWLGAEKPHQGVSTKNQAWQPAPNVCNSTTALGLRAGWTGNRVRSFCSGEQYDSDLALYYLRARYYNPNTGRFLSRDPEDGGVARSRCGSLRCIWFLEEALEKTMKLVRSDSPEVATFVASAGALACVVWSALTLACIACVLSLLIALSVSLIVSTRAAVWLGMPVFLALTVFLLWRGRSARLNWVIAGGADRMYVRLFARRGWGKGDLNEPDVLMLEASDIASVSARTVEVFLYGPKPKIVESLVIEPVQAVAESVFQPHPSIAV